MLLIRRVSRQPAPAETNYASNLALCKASAGSVHAYCHNAYLQV
jgi:hypothetical protein